MPIYEVFVSLRAKTSEKEKKKQTILAMTYSQGGRMLHFETSEGPCPPGPRGYWPLSHLIAGEITKISRFFCTSSIIYYFAKYIMVFAFI